MSASRKSKGKSSPVKRLQKAQDLLEEVWEILEPTDVGPASWEKLRELIIHFQAQQRRGD